MKNLLMIAIAIFGLAIISKAQLPSYVPSNGIVGWWPFNGNANDESGNGNDGMVYGASLTSDRFGNNNKAYLLNGINNYINVVNPISGILSFNGNAFSISCWVKSNDIYKPIVDKAIGANTNGDYFLWIGNTGKGYAGLVGSDSDSWRKSNSNINNDSWMHVTTVFTSPTIIDIYINGDLDNDSSQLFNFNLTGGNSDLRFGKGHTNFGDVYLDGQIDDIGIWNRALTEEEITSLYSGSTVGLNEVSQSNLLKVFPNPAQSVINVNLDAKLVGSEFKIYDNLGKSVKTGKINSVNTTIEINDLSGGIYIFNLGGNMNQTFKVIKE
jgi:hypothetical protein